MSNTVSQLHFHRKLKHALHRNGKIYIESLQKYLIRRKRICTRYLQRLLLPIKMSKEKINDIHFKYLSVIINLGRNS